VREVLKGQRCDQEGEEVSETEEVVECSSEQENVACEDENEGEQGDAKGGTSVGDEEE
jgi:hypothetical protein